MHRAASQGAKPFELDLVHPFRPFSGPCLASASAATAQTAVPVRSIKLRSPTDRNSLMRFALDCKMNLASMAPDRVAVAVTMPGSLYRSHQTAGVGAVACHRVRVRNMMWTGITR